jgi:predicted nucleic acid-binding protein
MNLRNNKKVFITESIWIALLDQTNKNHNSIKTSFSNLLDGKYYLITSSYVIDAVLEELKTNCSKEIAEKFLDIIDRSVLTNNLKVFWLSRRLRRTALDGYIQNDDIDLSQTMNILLMQQKKVHFVFTLNESFYDSQQMNCLHV